MPSFWTSLKMCHFSKGLMYAKGLDPGQPAQLLQADVGQYFLPLINFPSFQGSAYLTDAEGCLTLSQMMNMLESFQTE